jgi:hypothetical protein
MPGNRLSQGQSPGRGCARPRTTHTPAVTADSGPLRAPACPWRLSPRLPASPPATSRPASATVPSPAGSAAVARRPGWITSRRHRLTRRCAPRRSRRRSRSMLLCLSRGSDGVRWPQFQGGGGCSDRGLLLGGGQDRNWRPGWSASSYQVTPSIREIRPGTADGSSGGQQVRGSRISGQAVPGVLGSACGRAQVRVDLAGGVTLQAADSLGLGLPFFGAAFDVGAGGRVRSPCG